MNNQKQPENKKPEEVAAVRPPVKRAPNPSIHRGGGPAALMPGEKAQNFKGSMKQLLTYLGKYKLAILIVMVIASVSVVFSIFGPKIFGQATTALYEGVSRMIAGDPRGIDFAEIGQFLLRVLALYLGSALLDLIQGFMMTSISADITYRFRKEIAEKINRLPISFFDHITHGEVLSRVTNDVDTISQTLNQSLSQMITSLVSVVGILIMMFTINVQMTLIALTIVPLSLLIIRYVVKHSQRYFRKQQEYLGHINGHIEEMYSGHVVVKAFNGEAESIAKMKGLNESLYDSAWKAQLHSAFIMPTMRFIGNLGYVAVAILGGYLVIRKELSLGNIQAFIQYMRSFQQPLMNIANISNILQQTAAAAERVFEFLNEAEELPDPVAP